MRGAILNHIFMWSSTSRSCGGQIQRELRITICAVINSTSPCTISILKRVTSSVRNFKKSRVTFLASRSCSISFIGLTIKDYINIFTIFLDFKVKGVILTNCTSMVSLLILAVIE